MSVLISRSTLIEKLEEKMFDSKLMCPVIKLTDLIELIDEYPTAYDVEDILAALKIMRNDTNQGCLKVDMKKCNQYSDCGLCIMDRAIDIVKRGGIE